MGQINMEMLKEYYNELHDGKSVFWDEKGFASYWIRETNIGKECYIEDIYVKKQYRKENLSYYYADQVLKIAKEAKCDFLSGSVVPSANGSSLSMKMMVGYGFDLWESHENIIWFKKEIKYV